MYAVIRVDSLDPVKVSEATGELRWFEELRAEQPGFLGSIVIGLDGNRRVVVDLWESEECSRAGLALLGAWDARLLAPLRTEPSQLIGAGVTTTTGGLRLARSW